MVVFALLLPIAGWGTGCHQSSGGRVQEEGTSVHRGRGWAVRVPEGARVREEAGTLAVDAQDGRRWFDVTWHPANLPPESIAYAWGTTACAPIIWDEPSEPVAGTWISGGQCSIDTRRYHALVAVESYEHGRLLTTYLAEYKRLPYEDAWVDFVGTVLTLRAGDAPLPAPDHAEIREKVRAAAALRPGAKPIPGGGLLSGRVSERLTDIWQQRRQAPPPRDLAGR